MTINNNFTNERDDSLLAIGYHRYTSISRYRTICCALGMLSLNNSNSKEMILDTIEDIKKESDEKLYPGNRQGGERAIMVITLPDEENLVKNLIELGFEKIYEFHRRICYNQDDMLSMWILSW